MTPTPDGLSLGKLLRMVREERGWSARAVSYVAGLSPSYVSKLESGEIEPSLRAFARLAETLGLTNAEILFVVHNFMAFSVTPPGDDD